MGRESTIVRVGCLLVVMRNGRAREEKGSEEGGSGVVEVGVEVRRLRYGCLMRDLLTAAYVRVNVKRVWRMETQSHSGVNY